jgi:hypothetical protein
MAQLGNDQGPESGTAEYLSMPDPAPTSAVWR